MKIFHTSPRRIEKIDVFGIAGQCLFFADDVYVTTASSTVYTYSLELTEDKIIRARDLYDEEIIERVADMFGVDLDDAERLLDGRDCEWNLDGCDGEKSWWLQGVRGECAKKMGFIACKDEDEQGTVYIVPMLGREGDLMLEDE